MEPSRKSHATELRFFCGAMSDDSTEIVDIYEQLYAATINHMHAPAVTTLKV